MYIKSRFILLEYKIISLKSLCYQRRNSFLNFLNYAIQHFLTSLYFFQTQINSFDTIGMLPFNDIIGRYRFQANNLHLNFNPHEEISRFTKALLLVRDLTLTLLAGEFNFCLATKIIAAICLHLVPDI